MARFSHLAIAGFRNLEQVEFVPSPRHNLLIGPNGAGKTAILEAIHYLIRGRSFRTHLSSELVGIDVDRLLIRGSLDLARLDGSITELSASVGGVSVAVERPRGQKQAVRWNGEPVRGFSSSSRACPLQAFLPGLSDLVFGSPSVRRRWLDWGVFHVKHDYLDRWRTFSRLLSQRNALLKSEEGRRDASLLKSFTEQYAQVGQEVAGLRDAYLELWRPFFDNRLALLVPDLCDAVDVSIQPFGSSKSLSLGDLLVDLASRELKSGTSVCGPHRADVLVSLRGRPASQLASRGQGKLIAIAMLLSQSDVVRAQTDAETVFLLDDLPAELDERALVQVFEAIDETGSQTFSTTPVGPETVRLTDVLVTPEPTTRLFHVKHGALDEE
ncbi:MAG: DNA replication and repair protein RecF [Pseudomonadota bacterium]